MEIVHLIILYNKPRAIMAATRDGCVMVKYILNHVNFNSSHFKRASMNDNLAELCVEDDPCYTLSEQPFEV